MLKFAVSRSVLATVESAPATHPDGYVLNSCAWVISVLLPAGPIARPYGEAPTEVS